MFGIGENNAEEDYKDPALKSYNRKTFMVKNTVMETLKGALVGALIGAAVLGAITMIAPFLLPVIGPVLGLGGLAGMATGTIGVPALLTAAVTNGALMGGALGGAIKGGLALSNAGEAADGEEERLITKAQQNEMRKQRQMVLEQRRDMQKAALERQAMVQNPNMNLPMRGGDRGLSNA
jgi:hypothetical protein